MCLFFQTKLLAGIAEAAGSNDGQLFSAKLFMSSFTHSNQDFLGLFLPALPSTLKSIHFIYPLLVIFPLQRMTKPPKPTTSDTQDLMHSQYPVFPSELHLTDASLERRHSSAARHTRLSSPSTSACSQPSLPRSATAIHHHTLHTGFADLLLHL